MLQAYISIADTLHAYCIYTSCSPTLLPCPTFIAACATWSVTVNVCLPIHECGLMQNWVHYVLPRDRTFICIRISYSTRLCGKRNRKTYTQRLTHALNVEVHSFLITRSAVCRPSRMKGAASTSLKLIMLGILHHIPIVYAATMHTVQRRFRIPLLWIASPTYVLSMLQQHGMPVPFAMRRKLLRVTDSTKRLYDKPQRETTTAHSSQGWCYNAHQSRRRSFTGSDGDSSY